MTTLLIAEHSHTTLDPLTLKAVTAAQEIEQPITILVAGSNCDEAAQSAAKIPGVKEILQVDDKPYAHFLPETMARLIAGLASNYSHVVAASSAHSKNFLPRAAALLGVAPISDVKAIKDADTFDRDIHAGAAVARIRSTAAIKMMTIYAPDFAAAPATGGNAEIKKKEAISEMRHSRVIKSEPIISERPDLAAARIIVAVGKGVSTAEDFKRYVEPFADRLGAAVGASRAVVDMGYMPKECQVGQTGKIVTPDLYFAVGISGAIQHVTGMKDSKIIIAINKDADAPIFEYATYGLVADFREALAELTATLAPTGITSTPISPQKLPGNDGVG